MTAMQFLAEWAFRSSILILIGAGLLRVLRVKDPAIALAAWTAMLCGSAAIPVLGTALPHVPLTMMRAAPLAVDAPAAAAHDGAPAFTASTSSPPEIDRPSGARRATAFDWAQSAFILYLLIAAALLIRLCAGIAMSVRLYRQSRATGQEIDGIEIRQSESIACPVALGTVRPVILLPDDWGEWDGVRLAAVLAHERSHIIRRDPAVQMLSALHRAVLWFSPLSWYLHGKVVSVAEEASDDAAVAAIDDRTQYAELLLEFMQRGVRRASWQGVPMARYGNPDERINRILDATSLSRGVTRWSLAAIVAVGIPVAYLAAAGRPQSAAPRPVQNSAQGIAPGPAAYPTVQPAPAPPVITAQAAPPAARPQKAPEPLPADKSLTFDVASVKPFEPAPPSTGGRKGGRGGGGPTGPGTADPGRIHYPAIRLKDLILTAYDVKDFQVVGPSWLESGDESTRFVIDATMPPTTTKEEMRRMLQNLLAERFKLTLHRATKEGQTYSLVLARNGLKMKESAEVTAPANGAPPLPPGGRSVTAGSGRAIDAYGFPVWQLPPEGGTYRFFINGRGRLGGARVTTQELANELTTWQLRAPVTDDTGLKAKYDFQLTFSVPGWNGQTVELPDGVGRVDPAVASEPLADIFGAVQSQLGLKLEPKKGPVDVLVIDHIERRPTEN